MTRRSRPGVLIAAAAVVLGAATTVAVAAVSGGFGRETAGTGTLASCEPASPAGTVVQVGLGDSGGMGGPGGPGMMGRGGGAWMGMLAIVPDPDTVRAGPVTFVATNFGRLDHELLVLPAPADGVGTRAVGPDGKIDESQSLGEASTSCGGGPGDGIAPGSRSWVTVTLRPGGYELLCDVPWHYADGMFAPFTVT